MRLSRAVWGLMPGEAGPTGTFALPVGTVTFLLGDAESSTRHSEADAAGIGGAMQAVDTVVGAAIGRHGGVRPLEQGVGNSFVVAFARASEAVACALDIECELEAAGLPRVRMGLHTGEAELRDETRYFGRAVTRAARLRDLGHGGQVLLSPSCADLVIDRLPRGARIADLGPHRMRDLTRPEHVFQLVHPDLPADFPPLRSLDLHPHNLPVQLTTFVGREEAIREVGDLLAEHRLVTLAGSGGCGKTRLGLQVAGEVLVTRADAAWFVDLSALTDPDLVAATVMAVLGIREVPDQSHIDTLISNLRDQAALVLLDNCEHVLPAVSALVGALSLACARLAILATSREQLGVPGEVVWRVPCLSVPEESRPQDPESLEAFEAVRLFVDRARAARSNFAVTNESAPVVAAICQQLDGIPLALELAAARVRMMSVDRIAEGLSDRFRLLTGGSRGAMPRQQTLRASVDWSYDLLPEPERALLRRLSVFVGGLGLDGAEYVGAGDGVDHFDVLGLLAALVDKSLVQVDDSGERYRLLETIRAYAGEELAASGEETRVRSRHLDFFTRLADRAEEALWTSSVPGWLKLVGTEHDNFRSALDWSLAVGEYDAGARIVHGIANFLYIRGMRSEGLSRSEQFLAQGLDVPRRAALLWCAAAFAVFSDPATTVRYGETLTQLGREIADDSTIARGLSQKGVGQCWTVDPATSLATLADALETARAAGDDIATVVASGNSCWACLFLGRPRAALAHAENALATARSVDWTWGEGYANIAVADAAAALGDLGRAMNAGDAALELGSLLADEWLIERALLCRGRAGTFRGDPMAGDWLAQARALAEQNHDQVALPGICCDQGTFALSRGREEGTAILEAALPLADRLMPSYGVIDRCLLAEAALRRTDFDRARFWLDGARAMSVTPGLPWLARARAREARALGDLKKAWDVAGEGLESAVELGAQILVIDLLELLAGVAADTDRCEDALRIFRTAAGERDRLGYVRFPADRAEFDRAAGKVERALAGSEIPRAASDDDGQSVEEVLEYVRRGRGSRARSARGWGSLTPTERRVVELVMDGLSNAQISERMFVSTATVKSHLTHVFVKLGITNRQELSRAARVVIG